MPHISVAQIDIKRKVNDVKRKVNNRIDNTINRGIDKAIDATEDVLKGEKRRLSLVLVMLEKMVMESKPQSLTPDKQSQQPL